MNMGKKLSLLHIVVKGAPFFLTIPMKTDAAIM